MRVGKTLETPFQMAAVGNLPDPEGESAFQKQKQRYQATQSLLENNAPKLGMNSVIGGHKNSSS